MKSRFLALILISTTLGSYAQQLENRPVEPFDKIRLSGSVNVFYTNSDTLSLSVKAKSSEIGNVETRVVNSALIIVNKGKFRSPVTVYVKNNRLVYVESSGATGFETTNVLKGDSVAFNISGAAGVNARLEAKKINVVQSGASDLSLDGNTDQLMLNVSGASSFKGYDLLSKDVNILASGAAMAKVTALERIRTNATGASDVKIRGDAKDVSVDATASADVVRVSGQNKMHVADNDTMVYYFKHKKIMVIRTKRDRDRRANGYDPDDFKHWAGFSVGINGYMNSPGAVNLPKKYGYMDLDYRRSFNLQLNVFERQLNLVKNHMKLVTGLGLDFHLYELANKTTLNPDSSFTYGAVDSTNHIDYKKNKLRNTYVQVPLLLEFNTSNDPYKTFHVAIGVIGQFLISSRTKQVLEQNYYTSTRIRKDSYNMSPFAAKAHLNLGYKGWTFYAEYNLTPLFQSGKGPELYPFTVGLRVIPFA